ncbi:Orotidine 5'-phosphate decarboxylase [Streptococcus gallolyticus]|uniref:Orotidine 5'-phosphate decarboxylase n=1 Tax=Streptococcus gallolyticus TaxID=315405 RepID=A0A139MLS6_9STRE|nr:orotidine-5'-phosphate decarboxylase [Streptococcus gallolyticus]KXT64547.1 Orotidine 5'-phosphate decarboxylase [Streptococcus gallolyticus]
MFSDKYIEKVIATHSHLCVGLDPILDKYPTYLLQEAAKKYGKTPKGAAYAILTFNKLVIDLIDGKVPAIKPQLAYFEKYGADGLQAFWDTVDYAHEKGLLVIADAKRGDIGTTSEAYAKAFFKGSCDEWMEKSCYVDAVTVNPFLGSDGVNPFVEVGQETGCGTIILVKTSNPSSGELQDKETVGDNTVSELVCDYINEHGTKVGKYGYSDLGAVIGATYPEEVAKFRTLLPKSLFLMPGIGYQGGDVTLLESAFDDQGTGVIIPCSRAINYAYQDIDASQEEVEIAISKAVDDYNKLINDTLEHSNKLIWKNV